MTDNTLGRKLSKSVWDYYSDYTTTTLQIVKDSLKNLGVKTELVNKLARKLSTYHGACWLGAVTAKHYNDDQLLEVLTSSCLNNPPSKWKTPDYLRFLKDLEEMKTGHKLPPENEQ